MIIASNFKTNHTRDSAFAYLRGLDVFFSEHGIDDLEIVVFPPFTALEPDHFSHFSIGAQNAFPAKNGSFTGEIGLDQLSEFDISTILLGHSERRTILGESQELIARKFKFFAEQHFRIFYCIGEPLEVRQQGEQAVLEYLLGQFSGIDTNYPDLVVAYEPLWAIGTGVAASLEQIASTHASLRKTLAKVPLLYGGSVNAENIAQIVALPNVDGALVGSASWDLSGFKEIIKRGTK